MKYTVVLPYAYQPYFEDCMKTVKFPKENMLLVDNTVKNLGIMRSHNMGVEKMRKDGSDWLIILSAAIRFGKPGGLDFIEVLENNPDYYVVHGATPNVRGGKQQEGGGGPNGVFGWHLTAFNKEVFDNIGVWDENFTPYGLDDIDLSLRIQKHYKWKRGWDTFPIDVSDTTMAHSINLGNVKTSYPPKQAYFMKKWGRGGGDSTRLGYEHPFDNPEYGLDYWPKAGDPLANNEAWEYLKNGA